MNLIMGAAANLHWYMLEPFVSSMRNLTDYTCVLHCTGLSSYCYDRLREYNIQVVPVPEQYRDGYSNDYRWILYRDYIKANCSFFDRILLCDIRDVIFTGDFFLASEFLSEEDFLGLAFESGRVCDDPFNSSWMINKFGQETYLKYQEERVICSGTLWGTVTPVLSVCEQMASVIYRPPYCKVSDQSSLQYIINSNMLTDLRFAYSDVLSSDVHLTVATMGTLDKETADIFFHRKNILLLHQYDRFQALRDETNAIYRPDRTITNTHTPPSLETASFADYLYDLINSEACSYATSVITELLQRADSDNDIQFATWGDLMFLMRLIDCNIQEQKELFHSLWETLERVAPAFCDIDDTIDVLSAYKANYSVDIGMIGVLRRLIAYYSSQNNPEALARIKQIML